MDLSALMTSVGERAPMKYCEARPFNPQLVCHIDGDYMAYFAAGSENCSAGDARRNVLSRVSKLKTVTGAARFVMHLTHGASTKGDRFLAASTQPYQGQRKAGRKPRNWAFLREWLETYDGPAFEPKLWLTREADDGIAHVCTWAAKLQGLLHMLHYADKDLRQFAGAHVGWDDYGITEVPLGAYDVVGKDGLQYGHKWFWMQMLQGDSADHIPGLYGVGKGTADVLLAGTGSNAEAAPIVFGEYSKAKGDTWRDYFAEQAVLLWMRTDRNATLLNVLELEVFGPQLIEAFLRLDESVKQQRAALEGLKH